MLSHTPKDLLEPASLQTCSYAAPLRVQQACTPPLPHPRHAERRTDAVVQAQQDRNGVLEAAAEAGVVRGVTAWRQTLKGNRVQIRDGTLFNLETPTGKRVGARCCMRVLCHARWRLHPTGSHQLPWEQASLSVPWRARRADEAMQGRQDGTCNTMLGVTAVQVGQATTIHHWVYEDGTEGGPLAAGAVEPAERPSEEELSRAGGTARHLSERSRCDAPSVCRHALRRSSRIHLRIG